MNKLSEILKIANVHAQRIEMALDALASSMPFDAAKIEALCDNELLYIELLTSRFAKLQDYLGNKVFNEALNLLKEYDDNATMRDKLVKLERLEIIGSVELWDKMREVRNHISHEYPDKPALTAIYLNQVIALAPQLIRILHNTISRINVCL